MPVRSNARRIDLATTTGRRDAVARAWHGRTGGRFVGIPETRGQRPNQIALAGLPARPWWNAATFPFVRDLEAASMEISRELSLLLEAGYLRPKPIASIPPVERSGDQLLVDGETGGFEIFRLHYNGLWFDDNCKLCPATARAVRAVPRNAGTIGISVLLGGTRIRPHCGLSNAKLRCHLGLSVPPRCGLRVDGETRRWQEGRCVVFDDSFEHSVYNDSGEPRYVLILDVFHPSLSDADARWVAAQSLPPDHKHAAIRDAARWTR